MKTLGFLFAGSILFGFSPAADWLIANTPDWVSALIVVVGLPAGFYGLVKLLFTFARQSK